MGFLAMDATCGTSTLSEFLRPTTILKRYDLFKDHVCEVIQNIPNKKSKSMFGWSETRRMKNRERKIGWKMAFFTVWFRRENKRDRK